MIYKRGDIVIIDTPSIGGSVQEGCRPFIIVGNDKGNTYSPVLLVVPCTSESKKHLPTHVVYFTKKRKFNIVLCEQIMTIGKEHVKDIVGHLDNKDMTKVDRCLKISLGVS